MQLKDYTLGQLQEICNKQGSRCNGCPLWDTNNCMLDDVMAPRFHPIDWVLDADAVKLKDSSDEPSSVYPEEETLRQIPLLHYNPYDYNDIYFAMYLDEFEKTLKRLEIDKSDIKYSQSLEDLLDEYSQPVEFCSTNVQETVYSKFSNYFKNYCKFYNIVLGGELSEIAIYNTCDDPLGKTGADVAVRFTFSGSSLFDAMRTYNKRRYERYV